MIVSTRYGHEQLLAVANTRHGPGGHRGARITDGPEHDHLDTPRDARAFLADHDVEVPRAMPTADQLRALARIRNAVQLAADRRVPPALPPAAARATYRLSRNGEFHAVARGWDRVVDDLYLAMGELRAVATDLRRCGNPSCRFVFIDRSRNRSRRWCEMAVCGNRAKVGRHRHRASGADRQV